MEQYQIVPWDTLSPEESPAMNLEQYVPPELESLAYDVINSYDMKVSNMTLITSKPDKGGAIWRIETNRGPRSLKVLHRTPQRSLFSVGAQEYVVGKGARVPGIILTKEGKNSVVAGGKLWIVTDWIDTLTPVMKIDLEGAKTLCHGLGEFHQWSKGYVPPLEAGSSSRIYKWESQYQKIMTKIGWFRHIATAYPETQASAHLLSVLDTFEGQAQEIFKRFQASAYNRMVAKGEAHWGLAHQDYGWSNGQMGPGGIWVIDLDGVAFDLPIRDLRKIITSTMDDMGAWDLEWIRGVIAAYHEANPLDQETFELLWIDMAFPNEFYKHVKEVVFNPVTFMDTELNAILDRVVTTETNKWVVLGELEKDKAKYPAGNYTEVTVAPSLPYRYKDYAKGGTTPLPQQQQLDPSKPKRSDKRDYVRLVVNPDGKAKLIPGGERAIPRELPIPEREKPKKIAMQEEKPKKIAMQEEKELQSKKKKRRLQRAELPKNEKQLKSGKSKAPGSGQLKKAKKLTAASEAAIPSRPLISKPATGGPRRLRQESGGASAKRAVSASGPKAAKGTTNKQAKKTASGNRPYSSLRKKTKKARVTAYLSAYRSSMAARRARREYFDDLHGEAAGSEY
ncbi:CotS family spore coat protein [Paenibacillus sp. LHD-117]|uniref:CotS family spore coat protein n=1 Tax=Paenibacillus sp. LHD-117 TaxID=3071412 RepID=UPI0027E07C11|nr:CotS family spore coat protein [Paenibacillus sp. LHD-117]MDQ6418808.1 CotS family spore coat protein [Paenibacillus sp. LHD-117]